MMEPELPSGENASILDQGRNLCLDQEVLRLLAEGEVAPDRLLLIEDHLAVCEPCRLLLEKETGGPRLWELARKCLQPPGSGFQENDPSPGASRPMDPVLALLDPSARPEMLGTLGSYEIAGVLGRGGMGVVLKGFDPTLNRFVALKVLAPHLSASAVARKRFLREAKAAAAVTHENVIAIHGVSEFKGVPYLVMPLIRGESLQKRLRDEGPLSVEAITRIGMQTSAGLAAAHEQGLIHRDVKPANILLGTGTERVILTDFGLARAVDEVDLTVTGALPGTPRYMSPEQARGETLDPRTDLFSLGLVLYEMAAGQSPFRADSSYEVLKKINEADPRPLANFRTDLPDWLCDLISRLLAKNPMDRLASARDAQTILSQGLAHLQSPASHPAPRIGSLAHPVSDRCAKGFSASPIPASSGGEPAHPKVEPAFLPHGNTAPIGLGFLRSHWVLGSFLFLALLGILVNLVQGGQYFQMGLLLAASVLPFLFRRWFFGDSSRENGARSTLKWAAPFGLALVWGLGWILLLGYESNRMANMFSRLRWQQSQNFEDRLISWNALKDSLSPMEWSSGQARLRGLKDQLDRLDLGANPSVWLGWIILLYLVGITCALGLARRLSWSGLAFLMIVTGMWSFSLVLHRDKLHGELLSVVHSPEIEEVLSATDIPRYSDPVVVSAQNFPGSGKRLSFFVKAGYCLVGVARNSIDGGDIPELSFWAGMPAAGGVPFRFSMNYMMASRPSQDGRVNQTVAQKLASWDTTMTLVSPPPLVLSGLGQNYLMESRVSLTSDLPRGGVRSIQMECSEGGGIMSELSLGGEGIVIDGKNQEKWVVPAEKNSDKKVMVPLFQVSSSDPKSPVEAFFKIQLQLFALKLPDHFEKKLPQKWVFKGTSWKERNWSTELGLEAEPTIKLASGQQVVIKSPRVSEREIVREWVVDLPPRACVEWNPFEVGSDWIRLNETLGGYCFNPTARTIPVHFQMTLIHAEKSKQDPKGIRIRARLFSPLEGFPEATTEGTLSGLGSQGPWQSDPGTVNQPEFTTRFPRWKRLFFHAFASGGDGVPESFLEIQPKFTQGIQNPKVGKISTGFGTKWWKDLEMPSFESKQKDPTGFLVITLTDQGNRVNVLGQTALVEELPKIIKHKGFFQETAIIISDIKLVPKEKMEKVFEILKVEGYKSIRIFP